MPRERPKVLVVLCKACGSECVAGGVRCWVCGSPFTGTESTEERNAPIKHRKSAKQKAREVTEGDDDLASELGLI